MAMRYMLLAVAVAANLCAASADNVLAVSGGFTYSADTYRSPVAVKTTDELAVFVSGGRRTGWGICDSVSLTAPDGTVMTLVDNASSPGAAALSIDSAGLWMLSSQKYGNFFITVRHSLYGTQGNGTAVSPARIVDSDEVADLMDAGIITPENGYMSLEGADGMLDSVSFPSGYGLEALGGGLWHMAPSADGLLYRSAAKPYFVDSRNENSHAVKTADDLAELVSGVRRTGWGICDTVRLTAPGGSVASLVDSASSAGTAALPINAAGVWTLASPKYGEFAITVRHSLYGTQGNGTIGSPTKIVDVDEISDLMNAGIITQENGYVTFGELEEYLGSVSLPAGCGIESQGAGLWRIMWSDDGFMSRSSTVEYSSDSRKPGPDRTVHRASPKGVAYSGDNWTQRAEAEASLTVTSPSGTVTVYQLNGTDLHSVLFDEVGRWTITLSSALGARTSHVLVISKRFVLGFR